MTKKVPVWLWMIGAPVLLGLAMSFGVIIAVGWALRILLTWLTHRGTPSQPPAGRMVAAVGVLMASVMLCCGAVTAGVLRDGTGAPIAPARPAAAAPSPTASPTVAIEMPYLTGTDLADARSALFELGLRSQDVDQSPRGRAVYATRNWTVVATDPPAGTRVPAKTRVSLFVLKDAEAAWFAAHPVMPALPKKTEAYRLTRKGGMLDGMGELVLFRYAKGKAPKDAGVPYDRLRGVEPADEAGARAGLKHAFEYGSLVAGSIPAVGQPVRVGRLLVVLVTPEPRDQVDGSGELWIPPAPDDDDDDIDVPDWLCPTRFC
ncbi:hypothetical protein CS0771_57080 [Catellatospora sp. IY07-71]|uniref:PASTA domain-containing protein n=1 Tax=Catellatospora sp. IY07-71 TaxID=2728827 RepID=UPI001BB39515|nr:PASTA domain-containing protein [Catellatospora sp. IY07-71]BCJ76164.1 hypothetical protein CS0771_57080 [Catellatospora sp. IY07-71]